MKFPETFEIVLRYGPQGGLAFDPADPVGVENPCLISCKLRKIVWLLGQDIAVAPCAVETSSAVASGVAVPSSAVAASVAVPSSAVAAMTGTPMTRMVTQQPEVMNLIDDDDVMDIWLGRCSRMAQILADCRSDRRLHLDLPLPDLTTAALHSHAQHRIDDRLARGYVGGFKLGITHKPWDRWVNPGFGYRAKGYKELAFYVITESSDVVAKLERDLLMTYRRYGKDGNLVNGHGHALCLNRNPGGEGAHHGCSPFFLYLAVR